MTPPELSPRLLDDGPNGMIPWHDGTIIGVLAVVKRVAYQYGYAVAWHGSLKRDLDLLAVPWTEEAGTPDRLVEAIMEAVGGAYTPGQVNPGLKPHGRLAYAINLHPHPLYIDLSVMPLSPAPE